jgi:hypothetical protein
MSETQEGKGLKCYITQHKKKPIRINKKLYQLIARKKAVAN